MLVTGRFCNWTNSKRRTGTNSYKSEVVCSKVRLDVAAVYQSSSWSSMIITKVGLTYRWMIWPRNWNKIDCSGYLCPSWLFNSACASNDETSCKCLPGSIDIAKGSTRGVRLLFSICCVLVAHSNERHRSQGNFPQRSLVLLRGMCWLTAAQAVFPALGQQSLPVPLKPCNSTTITPPQTLCQDTVVTQPWASVPPLSTRLMDRKRRRGEKTEDKRTHWYFKKCSSEYE